MRNPVLFLLLGLLAILPAFSPVNRSGDPAIISPHPGDVVQGTLTVTGTTNLPGFASADLSFTYTGDTTGTWFLIAHLGQPVFSQALAAWNTSGITDGDYTLRLRVTLQDGSTHDAIVEGLRVRNYSAVETPTPFAAELTSTPVLTETPTATPYATPTPLPGNQAVLASGQLATSILYGGIGAVLLFIFLGIYLWLRRNLP